MKIKHKLLTTYSLLLGSLFLGYANANEWEESLPNAQSVSLEINLIPSNAPNFSIIGTPSFASSIDFSQRYHGTSQVSLNYSHITSPFVLHVYTRMEDYVPNPNPDDIDDGALGLFLVQNGDYVIVNEFDGVVNGQNTFANRPRRIPLKVHVFGFTRPGTTVPVAEEALTPALWSATVSPWSWVFELGLLDENDNPVTTGVAFVDPEGNGSNLTGSIQAKFGVDINGAISGIYERDVWFDIDLQP